MRIIVHCLDCGFRFSVTVSAADAVETITGTYTNPNHVMAYEDGEVRQQFSIAFMARLIGGHARTSSETSSHCARLVS